MITTERITKSIETTLLHMYLNKLPWIHYPPIDNNPDIQELWRITTEKAKELNYIDSHNRLTSTGQRYAENLLDDVMTNYQ